MGLLGRGRRSTSQVDSDEDFLRSQYIYMFIEGRDFTDEEFVVMPIDGSGCRPGTKDTIGRLIKESALYPKRSDYPIDYAYNVWRKVRKKMDNYDFTEREYDWAKAFIYRYFAETILE